MNAQTLKKNLDKNFVLNLLNNTSNHNTFTDLWKKYFIRFDNFTPSDSFIFNDLEDIKNISYLGFFEISKVDKIPVFIIQLNDNKKLNETLGKKIQFDIAKKILKKNNYFYSLFVFYVEQKKAFRVSFIHSNFSDGKQHLNFYKRNTFFVSEKTNNKTFLNQFGNCSFSSIFEVKNAFSIEPVTKEFYQLLEKWYYNALKEVQFPKDAESETAGRNKQLIRFITRLMFVWFMKIKGIIPEELFDKEKIKNLLNDEIKPDSSSYYLAILQNLFFATLNTPQKDRKFRKDIIINGENPYYMNHNVYRHHKLFKDPDTIEKLFKDIPFLNGGLFDCLDKKDNENNIEYRIDGFSDVESKQPKFPNFLLFNDSKENPGIIDIFKTFNFTTDESSAIDEEIALDPELLGKVFENLLASYNPETAQTARKASGSYYTPKEIVEFMTEQSLLYYLKTKLPHLDENTIHQIISYSDEVPDLSEKDRIDIIQSLSNCKIIDPACGSGVFPIGMLHKIIWILKKIDPDNNYFKKYLLRNVQSYFIDDKEITHLIKELEKRLEEKTDDYNRKLHFIENCIYGVDIQPIAIQIAKLRLFLSLLIEEQIDKDKDNMNLHPLPNLDLKFVIANTLIGLSNKTGSFDISSLLSGKLKEHTGLLHFGTFKESINEINHKYFLCKTQKEKDDIKEEFNKLKEKLYNFIKGYDKDIAEKIKDYNPFNIDKENDWFDPYLMLGVKDGFDIVIGNPPYIQLQKAFNDKLKYADLYKTQNFKTFERTGDIYCLFYEKGMELLKSKGYLCYITSNKWMRAGYGEKLREYFLKYNPILLVDLGPNVFENATVDTNILIIQKSDNENKLKAVTINESNKDGVDFNLIVNEKSVHLNKIGKDAWFIGSSAEQKLKEKIESIGKPLKDWDVKIYRGILTGLNEAFIIITEKRNEILANCKTEEERKRTEAIIKPILRGRDIKRYYYEWAGLWVIIIPAGWTNENRGKINAEEFIQEQFPSLISHLKPFKEKAKKRDDQGDYWWELRACAYYPEFEKEKVVWQRITQEPTFCLVKPDVYVLDSMAFFTGNNLKYIMAILNSKLIYNYVEMIVHQYGFTGFRLSNQYVEVMPISPITSSNKPIVQQIELLVDKILAAKKENKNADTSEWEREIDQLVYKLYDLNEEEIRIIENK